MIEEECDAILRRYEEGFPLHWPQEEVLIRLIESTVNDGKKRLDVILSILENDGFIEPAVYFAGDVINRHVITAKGRSFINTTSYAQERHKQELEKHQNKKSIRKMEIELKLNEWYLRSRWLPHILALLSLLVAGIALIVSLSTKAT